MVMFLSALCVEELMILFIDKKIHETRILTFDRIYITHKKNEQTYFLQSLLLMQSNYFSLTIHGSYKTSFRLLTNSNETNEPT